MQDFKFALRQLRKYPGFTLTVILTLALGIGANTAIFTLVHAVLLSSLPVADPATLYRIGDKDDCCVNGGFLNKEGDFDLFSYELFRHFQENTPEFEQLAAFQAGHNQMNIRRAGGIARAERTEYVSGNYFTTFGVGAFAGRTIVPADDVPGAAPVTMLSYQVWQADYAADPSIVGATVYVQGQPMTVVGIAPPKFFGDRIDSDPPQLWVPLASEPYIEKENAILNRADANWLYAIGRVKPGVSIASLQAKISTLLRQWLSTQKSLHREWSVLGNSQAACSARLRRRRSAKLAAGSRQWFTPAHDDLRAGFAGGMRQHCQPDAGPRRNPPLGNFLARSPGRGAQAPDPPDADGKYRAGMYGRICWPGHGLCRHANDSCAGLPGREKSSHRYSSFVDRPGLCFFTFSDHGSFLRHSPRVDHLPLESSRSPARSEPLDA